MQFCISMNISKKMEFKVEISFYRILSIKLRNEYFTLDTRILYDTISFLRCFLSRCFKEIFSIIPESKITIQINNDSSSGLRNILTIEKHSSVENNSKNAEGLHLLKIHKNL